eukprot:gene6033-10035_t
MKNLTLLNKSFINFGQEKDFKVVGLTDEVSDSVHYFVTEDGMLYGFNRSEGKISKIQLKTEESGVEDASKILGLKYISEQENLCMISDLGEIITYSLTTKEIEIVGIFQEGLLEMKWSPNEEIVLFITRNKTCLSMNKEWDTIYENLIFNEEEEKINDDISFETDISWRNDGEYYVINGINSKKERSLKVYERNGNFVSKNEKRDNLDKFASWKPDGSLITAVQYKKEKDETNVLFFEKNGLQHYEFLLEKGKSKIHNLEWNSNSEILSIFFTPSNSNQPMIQLWYRNNYHWYLKQEIINFGNNNEYPIFVKFDSDNLFLIHTFSNKGNYHSYSFQWEISNSIHHLSKDNSSLISVIDRKQLLLTPLKYCLIPPPMSCTKIETDYSINSVSFWEKNIFIFYSNEFIDIFKYEDNSKKPPTFSINPIKIERIQNLKNLNLITPINSNLDFYFIKYGLNDNSDSLYFFDFEKKESIEIWKFKKNEKIIKMIGNANDSIWIQNSIGQVYLFNKNEKELKVSNEYSFSNPCYQILSLKKKLLFLFGLTERGVLYLNSKIIISNCTSFTIHNDYLLYTTFNHELRLINLNHESLDLIFDEINQKNVKNNETFRSIERGGKIISSIPFDFKVVLQMPRGNLEGIYPRRLLLSCLFNLLNEKNYKESIFLIRKHKIDMNLIYDHNPKLFLNNLKDFILQIEDNIEYLNLFITQLNNDNVTKTIYSTFYEPLLLTNDKQEEEEEKKEKLNLICSNLRDMMKKENEKKYITSILTTYVKQNTFLEEALLYLKNMKDLDLSDQGLKYLIFLSDVDKLFDIALGMYDFEMVKIIAKKSQKDPKEYLNFLEDLQKYQTFYQRFKIDSYLKKYELGLQNLSKYYFQQFVEKEEEVLIGENDEMKKKNLINEILNLISKNQLYEEGIKLFSKEKEVLNLIFEKYGDYLFSIKNYKQSGLIYLKGDFIEKSQNSFIKDGDFIHTFTLSKKLNQSKDVIKEISDSLIKVLKEKKEYLNISYILKEYLNNVDESIDILCKHSFWNESLKLSINSNRFDLIETNLKPEILKKSKEELKDIKESIEKFEKYLTRLLELREELKHKENIIYYIGGAHHEKENLNDDFSDTSSIQSGYSGVSILSSSTATSTTSTTSSRQSISKKKSARNKLKKGSPFEQDLLVKRLYSLIPSIEKQNKMKEMIENLIFFKYYQDAQDIQIEFAKFIKLIEDSTLILELEFTPPPIEGEKDPLPVVPEKIDTILGLSSYLSTTVEFLLYSPYCIFILFLLCLLCAHTTFHTTEDGFNSNSTAEEVSKGLNLNGKIIIVTGSNTGIGKETARVFASKGAHVILSGRDEEKLKLAKKEIITLHRESKIDIIPLDLGDKESVQTFVKTFEELHLDLHILVLNAGVLYRDQVVKTKDGFEAQIGINHFSYHRLTMKLLPFMKKTIGERRIVVVSSAFYSRMKQVKFDDIELIKENVRI